MTNKWNKTASKEIVEKTIAALNKNGINATIVRDGEEAKKKVFELIPKGAKVMVMSSVTLDSLGISKEINESEEYNSIKNKLMKLDRKTQSGEMRKLGAAPDYSVGSVNAVTEDGEVLIASNTGSQLPAYAYASGKVIWVVGTQKITKNIDKAVKRIYEHSLVLESERLKKIYGVESFVSKILIINRELVKGRLNLIFVPEILGF